MSEDEDDVMREIELEGLVKTSVLEAVENVDAPVPVAEPEAIVLVGRSAKNTIRRAVMSSVKHLINEQMLQGPLKIAADRVSKVSLEVE